MAHQRIQFRFRKENIQPNIFFGFLCFTKIGDKPRGKSTTNTAMQRDAKVISLPF
jgi:hypothetical protein